jgi:hypothetical protein
MAGEFYVMERLYRLGHQPALTLGTAKSIDILLRSRSGNLDEVSVKAVCGGGKWGVGTDDLSKQTNRIFIFLHYKKFDDVKTDPEVYVVPAAGVERLKSKWFKQYGVYFRTTKQLQDLAPYRDAWDQWIR